MNKSKVKNNSKSKKNQLKVSYTLHTLQRMNDRIITKLEIEEAVKYGMFYVEGSKKFKVVYKNVNIIVKEEKKNSYTVITVKSDSKFEKKLKTISKEEKTSIRKVAKRIKNIKSSKELYSVAK